MLNQEAELPTMDPATEPRTSPFLSQLSYSLILLWSSYNNQILEDSRRAPWSRKWKPTPVFLPGEFHAQRSLLGYSPWNHKESDTTEIRIALFDFPGGSVGKESAYNVGDLGLIPGLGRSPGEGNGNPLQYSYLENFMDRGTWRATFLGVSELDVTE